LLFNSLSSFAEREIVFFFGPLAIHLPASWKTPFLSLVLSIFLFYYTLLWNIRKWGKDKLEIENRRFFFFNFLTCLILLLLLLTFDINGVGIKVVMDFFLFLRQENVHPYISL